MGPKPASDVIHIAIGIPYRDQAQIQAFDDSVSSPASPNYRHFITPDEVGWRFGLAPSQVHQVADYLTSNGIKIRRVAKNRLAIVADATVAQAEAAFHTTIEEFFLPGANGEPDSKRFSYTAPPSVPASIRPFVLSIEGLEDFNRPRHALSLTASQLQTLYSAAATYNAGYQGQGRTIGITDLTTYGLSNIPLLYSLFDLPTPPGGIGSNVSVVSVDGSNGNVSSGADGEGDADIQCTLSMAPLCNLVIYDGSDGGLYLATLTAESDANACDIITESYGVDGSGLNSWHNVHLSMTAQGITYLCAAGDRGTTGLLTYPYPDADPEVLSVGGTTVALNSNGSRVSEVVWDVPKSDGKGIGGGGWATITNSWNALPSWQVGTGVPTDIPYRLVPDVTIDADPNSGYEGYLDGNYRVVGGTSCGSPTMAGMLADCQQQIIAAGGLPVQLEGFLPDGASPRPDLLLQRRSDCVLRCALRDERNPAQQRHLGRNPGLGYRIRLGAIIASGFVNRFLGAPTPASLMLNPSTVTGGSTAGATVTLNLPAPTGGLLVKLSSSSAGATVPSNVTIPAGAISAVFTVNTLPVSKAASAVISAAAGTVPSNVSATLTINPAMLSTISVAPTAVIGGNPATGTIALTGPAGPGGISVAVSSSNSIVTVPATVTVPAGLQLNEFPHHHRTGLCGDTRNNYRNGQVVQRTPLRSPSIQRQSAG